MMIKGIAATPATIDDDPTPREMEALLAIHDYRVDHGYSPTIRELARLMDCCVATAFQMVDGLDDRGLLQRELARKRNLRPTPRGAALMAALRPKT